MNPNTFRKIKTAVDALVPAKQEFAIYSSPTGFDKTEVIRVITPAWRTLGKAERIEKVQNAIVPRLEPNERERIFRFSVLTPEEWKSVQPQLGEKSKRLGYRRGRAESRR